MPTQWVQCFPAELPLLQLLPGQQEGSVPPRAPTLPLSHSLRLRGAQRLWGALWGRCFPHPQKEQGQGCGEQGQPVQAVGQQGQDPWGNGEAQKVAILTLWPTRPCSPGIPSWPGSP